MNIYVLLIISLLGLGAVHAQPSRTLDTIYANDQKNVVLFFPEPIRQGIVGSDNFVFTFNREREQYFGLLQATPGKESNLLVINKDGLVFSYIIKYKEELTQLNYFLSKSDSLGSERPLPVVSTKTPKDLSKLKREGHYKQLSALLLKRNQRIGRIKKRHQRITISLKNIVFDEGAFYFVIEIDNRSGLDYDVNFLKVAVQTRKKGKKKSLQTLYKEPLLKYYMPEKIAANTSRELVYVLPKFSLSKDQRVVLELKEKNGERNVKLNVSHRFINNPN